MDVPKFDEDVLFGKSPLGVIIELICVQRSKRLDDAIFGEINEIIKENEHLTVVDLNEKAIVEALEKQIPKKPIAHKSGFSSIKYCCPCCSKTFIYRIEGRFVAGQNYAFCSSCGQKIDWSETE